jgi:hypothetical protein
MSKITLQEINAKVEASNEEFNNATPAVKRMMIAQDLIDRIQAEQLIPSKMGAIARLRRDDQIIAGSISEDYEAYKERFDKSIKSTLQNPTIKCEVCAKGGMFMAYVARVNEFSWKRFQHGTEHNKPTMHKLREIFDEKQLSAMECAFEGKMHISYNDQGQKMFTKMEIKTLYAFYKDRNYSTDRLLTICQNVIDNEGTFKLEGLLDRLPSTEDFEKADTEFYAIGGY